ncbi:MAG: restriction endonuclease subunit S [Firmicutes bacterium]|nr:restriction endonuclease subunit S [Bacillota bacterium]
MTNVPEIRFKGFTDAWEQRTLGDVCGNFRSGNSITADNIYEVGEYPVYGGNGLRGYTDSYTHEGDFVLIGRQGALCGNINIAKGKVYISEHAVVVSENELSDIGYLVQLLTKLQLNRFSESSAQPGLSVDKLKKIDSSSPTKEEQARIGVFFRTLDNTIAIYKRKLYGLRELKKAYLQQMFPQEGEVVPRLRFEGFTEPWELRGADEVFCTVSDKGHSRLPVLSASQEHGMILRNEIGIDIKLDSTNATTYKRVLPGQFVIHLRSFQGGLAYSNIEGITSPAYTILDFIEKDKQVPDFWIDVLRSVKFIKMLESVTYGIRDGRSISFNDFSILKLPYPSHNEQEAIGKFFRSLDGNIGEVQSKIDAFAKLKSAYLQKMFV